MTLSCIQDLKHGFYINLESRKDRKIHMEQQLNELGFDSIIQRFSAVKMENGSIGCSISHLKCLEMANKNKWGHVMILEDDLIFLKPTLFLSQLDLFLKTQQNNRWDVILLAGNNAPPYTVIDNTCVKVTRCQTTTGYIVNGHYIETLMKNVKEGVLNLIKEPTNRFSFAIDKYWFSLQQRDDWFLIIPLTVVQKDDYSDIEKKIVNYKHLMVDLDKKKYLTFKPLNI